jgi:hypothetical protein
MVMKQTIRRVFHGVANRCAKKCNLGQKNAGNRAGIIFEIARMIELLQSPKTFRFAKIL